MPHTKKCVNAKEIKRFSKFIYYFFINYKMNKNHTNFEKSFSTSRKEYKKTTRTKIAVGVLAVVTLSACVSMIYSLPYRLEYKYELASEQLNVSRLELEEAIEKYKAAQDDHKRARIALAKAKIKKADDTKEIKRLASLIEQEELLLKGTVRK